MSFSTDKSLTLAPMLCSYPEQSQSDGNGNRLPSPVEPPFEPSQFPERVRELLMGKNANGLMELGRQNMADPNRELQLTALAGLEELSSYEASLKDGEERDDRSQTPSTPTTQVDQQRRSRDSSPSDLFTLPGVERRRKRSLSLSDLLNPTDSSPKRQALDSDSGYCSRQSPSRGCLRCSSDRTEDPAANTGPFWDTSSNGPSFSEFRTSWRVFVIAVAERVAQELEQDDSDSESDTSDVSTETEESDDLTEEDESESDEEDEEYDGEYEGQVEEIEDPADYDWDWVENEDTDSRERRRMQTRVEIPSNIFSIRRHE